MGDSGPRAAPPAALSPESRLTQQPRPFPLSPLEPPTVHHGAANPLDQHRAIVRGRGGPPSDYGGVHADETGRLFGVHLDAEDVGERPHQLRRAHLPFVTGPVRPHHGEQIPDQ